MTKHAHPMRPIVLVPADNRMLGEHPFHVVGRKYVEAVRLAGCLPLVVPWAGADEVDELLAHADGVLLTGSPSNVHPSHFGEDVHDPALPLDPARDDWTLPLTRKALARACRCSPSAAASRKRTWRSAARLHQAVQEQPGKHDHRAPSGAPADVQYGLAHDDRACSRAGCSTAHPRRGRRFAGQLGARPGRQDLARAGARVEAVAPDGLVEAFSMPAAAGLQPVRAVAPRMARRRQPGVDEAAARLRRAPAGAFASGAAAVPERVPDC